MAKYQEDFVDINWIVSNTLSLLNVFVFQQTSEVVINIFYMQVINLLRRRGRIRK